MSRWGWVWKMNEIMEIIETFLLSYLSLIVIPIIIGIIVSILNIILFFKIWGMTNNVAKILRIMKRAQLNEKKQSAELSQSNYSEADVDNIQHDENRSWIPKYKIGDKVIRKSDGKRMTIVSFGIKTGTYNCNKGGLAGLAMYAEYEIE